MRREFISSFLFLSLLISCLSFLFPSLAFPQQKGHGVEVVLKTSKLVKTEPGKIITVNFLVINHTKQEETFVDELKLPPGWQRIIPAAPFTLKPNESQFKLLALLVPRNAPAGRHEMIYSIHSRRDQAIADRDTFEVVVVPVAKLEMLVESQPSKVIAGESYQAVVRLLNKGNAPQKITLQLKVSPDYPARIDPSEMVLEAGASQTIRVQVKTDATLNRKVPHFFSLRAETRDAQDKPIIIDQTISVEIVLRVTGDLDPYHRLPARLRLIGLSEDGQSGGQIDFYGAGSLDEEGKRTIDFRFLTPNAEEKFIFGQRDEYRLGYADPLFGLSLGDWGYSLSPLTEFYKYGRGLEANIHPGRFDAGGFYLQTRWGAPTQTEIGVYAQYEFHERFQLKGNFLKKDTDATASSVKFQDYLYSAEAKVMPFPEMNAAIEYAIGKSEREEQSTAGAYRVYLDGKIGEQSRYSFEKTHAEPKFFGYYHDTDYTYGTLTFPIYSGLRGKFSYRSFENNLDLDPAKFSATSERSYQTGMDYRLSWGTDLSLDYEDFSRKDRLSPSSFDFAEKAIQLGAGQNFGMFNLQAYGKRWILENHISGIRNNDQQRVSLYASFQPTEWQTYGFYVDMGNMPYTGTTDVMDNMGFSVSWRAKTFDIDLSYQKNNYNSVTGWGYNTILSSVNYRLPWQHVVYFKCRWVKGIDEGTSFFLSYQIPLKIPVGRKKSVAVLKGKVYDAEKPDRPRLANAIITAGGQTAVADQSGEFIFPSLAPGEYYLGVDKASIGMNRVTSEKLPVISVTGGKATEVDLGITTSCRVSGKIILLAPKKEFVDKDQFDIKNMNELVGLGNVLVEISRENEVVRQFTDGKGRFSFEDLRPGNWTLKLRRDDLPPYHYFEKEEFPVVLKPGEQKEKTIKVFPRLRRIEIVNEGVIREEKHVSAKPFPVAAEIREKQETEIMAFLASWVRAWEASAGPDGPIGPYIAHFSKDFQDGAMDLAALKADKAAKNRRKEWIRIGVSNVRVLEPAADGTVTVHFVQDYESSNYADKTEKTLVLRREGEGWKIIGFGAGANLPVAAEIREKPETEIMVFLASWVRAWEASAGPDGSIGPYIAHFSKDFRDGAMDLAAWKADKIAKNRRKEWIRICIRNVRISVPAADGTVAVHFVQDYESSNYGDKTEKTLVLRREGEGWKIIGLGKRAILRLLEEIWEKWETEIMAFLASWVRAWEASAGPDGPIGPYIAHFSKDFRDGAMDLAALKADKAAKNRCKEWIRICISNVRVLEPAADGTVTVHFLQTYESANYADKTKKPMVLRREGERWKIIGFGEGVNRR